MQATKTDDAFRLPILPEAEIILLKYDYQPHLRSKIQKSLRGFSKGISFDRKIESQDFTPR